MALKECMAIIAKAAGEGKIDEPTAMGLLEDLNDFFEAKKKAISPENLDDAVATYLKGKLDESIMAAVIEKRNALINTAVEVKAIHFMKTSKLPPAQALKALMGGTIKSAYKGKLSIDASGKALTNKYVGRLIDRIDKDGDLQIFNSGKIDDEIAIELFEMRPNGEPGKSGSEAAQRIARHIHTLQATAIKGANHAGGYINERPGYIFRQSHDSSRLRKAGFEEWYKYVVERLDHDATFDGADPREFLEGAYNGLITGVHHRFDGGNESNYLMGFKGPANVAKRVSQQRLLHFKSGDSFMEYNRLFGTGDLREGVVRGLEHMARNTALMQGLGTNPLQMLTKLKTRAASQAQKIGDFKSVDELNSASIENMFKEIDGTTRIPGNISIAKVNAGIRMVQNMARLGGATISSITDIPAQAAELRHQGIPLFSAYANAFGNLFRGRGSAEQRTIARYMGIGFDGITGDLMSRFGSTDHLPGTMSKMQQKFFKLNLMSWWNDSHRTGMGLMMSANMADSAKLSYDKLGAPLQNVLRQYGILDSEWNVLRKNAISKADNDVSYMVSDNLDQLSDSDIVAYLKEKGNDKPTKRQITTARTDLISMLDTFYIDRADHGIPMPGAAERAIMNQGTVAGTVNGEIFRHLMQFKSFPITMIRRGLGREIKGQANGKADLVGLSQLLVASTIFGYGAMYMKDILKGRTPREFTGDPLEDSKLIAAAMSQGGGLGIYGDFMFGEYSRYGRSFLATMAGPTLGQLDDVAEIWTRLRTGEDVAAKVVQSTINNTPFVNLFYTRMALDYLFLYQLQESVNPGYLRRMENRIMRENDQKFFVPPSREIPRGGGSKLFEGVR